MEAYAGIDLHSSNSYIAIIDEQDQRHFGKKLLNSLTQIVDDPLLQTSRKMWSRARAASEHVNFLIFQDKRSPNMCLGP